jgi:cytochrome-b5 reductase
MDFLQGQSVETTVAVGVAVVAVAAGGAFLLLRSKKPKGMCVTRSFVV